MKKLKTFLQEARNDIYFDTYREAVQYALDGAEAQGWQWEFQDEMTMATTYHKPSEGKTTSWTMPIYKMSRSGRKIEALLAVQIYDTGRKYELNWYTSR